MRWNSQCQGVFKFTLELSDHVKFNLDSFFWFNVPHSDIHDWSVFLLLCGHHYCIASVLSCFVFRFDHLSEFDRTLDDSIFVSDFELGESVGWIDRDGVMNLKGFGEGIGVFLDGLDFDKLVFDSHFVLVWDDRQKTFLIVLDKKVAKGGQWSACQWTCAILDLHFYVIDE